MSENKGDEINGLRDDLIQRLLTMALGFVEVQRAIDAGCPDAQVVRLVVVHLQKLGLGVNALAELVTTEQEYQREGAQILLETLRSADTTFRNLSARLDAVEGAVVALGGGPLQGETQPQEKPSGRVVREPAPFPGVIRIVPGKQPN